MRVIIACILLLGITDGMAQVEGPSGMDLFIENCAACHGPRGEGDGPVAAVMQVTVPNLRTLSERNGGVFPREAVTAYVDGRDVPASHGSRLMPIWGDEFSTDPANEDEEANARRRIDAVVSFVEELQYR